MKCSLFERTEKYKVESDKHYFYLSEKQELYRDAPRWYYNTENRAEVLQQLLKWADFLRIVILNRKEYS